MFVCFTVKNCTPPATVANSTLVPVENSYNYGDTITYTCAEGYQNNTGGPLVRNCTDTDTWSGTPPICGGMVKSLCLIYQIKSSLELPVDPERYISALKFE